VVARLKELKIPYEIKEGGTSVAVPKERVDEARLGLAEKNLPLGGAVGWEIFDESKLGATDFDRRIQLIRAISGELSRTIRRISAVEDCRVQIVLPETHLFEVEKAPVTASVLIKAAPGEKLLPSQVNGIIHLVASSVENLKPNNVTVVDNNGNILMAEPPRAPYRSAQYGEEAEREVLEIKGEEGEKVSRGSGEAVTKVQQTKETELQNREAVLNKREQELRQLALQTSREALTKKLTGEEKLLLKLQAKQEYEEQLTQKAQSILNQFYPPNAVIVKISLELAALPGGKKGQFPARREIKEGLVIGRMHTIILVDNRLDLSKSLKRTTYATIAAAVGYDKARGDRIIIKRVPFHYALTPGQTPAKTPAGAKTSGEKMSWLAWVLLLYEFVVLKVGFGNLLIGILVVFILLILVSLVRSLFGRRRGRQFEFGPAELLEEEEEVSRGAAGREVADTIEKIRGMAGENPERLAALLKSWLSEEVKA
jgi:flagellar M-ring protein FliF